MSSLRQSVLAALDFKETLPLPYTLPIEAPVASSLDEYYGSPAWRDGVQEAIAWVSIPRLGVRQQFGPRYVDLFGATWRTDQRPYHLERPALIDPELSGYRWPTIDEIWDAAAIQSQIEAAQARGQFIVVSTGFGLFERSWTLRGFENALTDMLLHPAFYTELLEGILEVHLQVIQRLQSLAVDGILLSDDWGEQRGVIMGPRLWRKFIQPRARRYFEAVHAGGKWAFQHCCGSVFEIIPEMIDCGLDVLESLQPEAMDVYTVKRQFGKDLRLWGGLGTQNLIPFGKPGEIRQEVARLRSELGRGGGYILAPAKPLMEGVPPQNAAAVFESFTQEA
jgi:uroporphyrinogen decarboxylase